MFLPATPGLTDDKSTITLESASSFTDEHDRVIWNDQTDHITLSSSSQAYAASIASTQSSTSHRRERVMGLTVNGREPSIVGTKAFVPQKVSDVVPFAEGHPFAAWDTEDAGAKTHRQPSVRLSKKEQVNDSDDRPMRSARAALVEPGWRLDVKGKKAWTGDVGVYRVGWERIVLDMEARVHEALWEINDSHTFADFANGQEPKTVLDVSCGCITVSVHAADTRSGPEQVCGLSLRPSSGPMRHLWGSITHPARRIWGLSCNLRNGRGRLRRAWPLARGCGRESRGGSPGSTPICESFVRFRGIVMGDAASR